MNNTTPAPNPVPTMQADNDTCFDTPDWQIDTYLGMAGCDAIQVSCSEYGITPSAIDNCCKCKKECCGKCGGSWDIFNCGPQTAAPVVPTTRAPTDTTACFCSGGYSKTCPKELVPNWPDDCNACCSYLGPGQAFFFGLFVLIPFFAMCIWCYLRKKRQNDNTTRARATEV